MSMFWQTRFISRKLFVLGHGHVYCSRINHLHIRCSVATGSERLWGLVVCGCSLTVRTARWSSDRKAAWQKAARRNTADISERLLKLERRTGVQTELPFCRHFILALHQLNKWSTQGRRGYCATAAELKTWDLDWSQISDTKITRDFIPCRLDLTWDSRAKPFKFPVLAK